MTEPYIAQITLFAGNFAIRGWAYCSGQLLAISSNEALFSLLGTTYGGDGRTTFALPDLRGRSPRGSEGNSSGPGLSPVALGQRGGNVSHTMTVAQMANHRHIGIQCNPIPGTQDSPKGNYLAANETVLMYHDTAGGAGDFTAGNTGATGGNQAFDILNPYLGLNYLIATQGVFPSE